MPDTSLLRDQIRELLEELYRTSSGLTQDQISAVLDHIDSLEVDVGELQQQLDECSRTISDLEFERDALIARLDELEIENENFVQESEQYDQI